MATEQKKSEEFGESWQMDGNGLQLKELSDFSEKT